MRRLYDSLPAFHDELEKLAGLADFVAKNQGMLGSAGALLGHGAAAGAVLGGVHGAYKNYREAKDQGAGTGAAGVNALGGALQGGLSGAAAGGLIGGGAGAALHTLRPQAAEGLRKALSSPESSLGALGRFGQRQVHGLTGWKPSEGLSSDAIRGGSWASGRAAQAATGKPGFDKAQALHELQKQVEDKGLTNLPGLAGALGGPERGEALKLLGKHTWSNADPLTKAQLAMAPIGIGAALSSGGDDPHKGESIGQTVGRTVGSIAGSPLPFAGSMAVGSLGASAGKHVGKAVDWLRNRTKEAPPAEALSEQHVPSERQVGSSANGEMQ